ncbi:hypothetical protein [Aquimarina sp. 2201CG5-10]|uniref:hypothetical protein n=1 Tax=Aquimarina callyspongiae TaxID=3098150 RepID=UPI002AB5DC3A|nr:hypothetical protein [Aquimarina sp. 2201CG5-10]MDY8134461.1 hypothetical protein [Aquimarina sp. 2201CG5-10]
MIPKTSYAIKMIDQLFQDISEDIYLRINQIDNIDKFDLTKVEKGILSIHARWSEQSVIHGKSILRLINNSEIKDFEIIIIDIDRISSQKQIELIGTVSQGYFESVWIENGRIEFNYRDNKKSIELIKFKNYLNEKINKSQ